MASATLETAMRANEVRELLDRALTELDADERSGSLLRAARLRIRLELTDLQMVIRVDASDELGGRLRWSFEDEPTPALLDLRMDSATANAYLQGRQSLAVAIARGRVSCSVESTTALLYVPALRLVVEPYRRWVGELHPHLALG